MKKALILVVIAWSVMFSAVAKEPTKIIVAYVSSGTKIMPDPTKMTHINYAFGVMNPTHDGVIVQRPEFLHKIVALKKQNPRLKVMLSIGGWGAGGFSEMASNDTTRAAFVANCLAITKEFKLDGIDMDWEYPGSSSAGIKSTPNDKDNFTKLIIELRSALGKKKLVTFASASSARHVDFAAVMPYLDFVNIMTYDMGRPSRGMHHSALFPSVRSRYSVAQSVQAHQKAGVPNDKLVVGMPFYAHANTKLGYSDFMDFAFVAKNFKGKEFLWDDVAKVPYINDSEGNLLCVYDDARSLEIKCNWIMENKLRGAMYWEYACDDIDGTLRNTVFNSLFKK